MAGTSPRFRIKTGDSMSFKRAILCLLALVCIFGFPLATIAASDFAEQSDSDISYYEEISHLGIEEFLYQAGLDFLQYIGLMNELFTTGRLPHYLPENTSRYENFAALHPEISFGEIIAYVNVNLDVEFYYGIAPVPDPYFVGALVNSNFILPANWVPSDLTNIGQGHMLRAEAAGFFSEMRDALTEDGLRLQTISTFRSYDTQRGTHRRAVYRFGQESADRQIARPGHSEHQMGLAADILHRGGFSLMTQAEFENTEQFEWLLENAHNFGFILRYPEEYMHIHGVIFEPWHWRFVGVDIATIMHEQGILLYEEFYGRYLASDVLKTVRDTLLGHAATVSLTRAEYTNEALSLRFGDYSYILLDDVSALLIGTKSEFEPYETEAVEQPTDGTPLLSMPTTATVMLNDTETALSAREFGTLTFYRIDELAGALDFELEISENGTAIAIYAAILPAEEEDSGELTVVTVEVPVPPTVDDTITYEYEAESLTEFESTLLLIIFGTAGAALLAGIILSLKLRQGTK